MVCSGSFVDFLQCPSTLSSCPQYHLSEPVLPVSAACFVHDKTALSRFFTDVVANEATAEEMCPQFPEPVPLKHPITPLKAALEKVDLFKLIFLIHIKV